MKMTLSYTEERIITAEFPDDVVKHKIITEYEPAGNGTLEVVSRRVEYQYGIPAPAGRPLIPLCFFEAVKLGAFREAASYLAPSLRENAGEDPEKFYRGFFGDFAEVLPNIYDKADTDSVVLLYKKENGCEVKLFTAEFSDGLLSNFIGR
jgi:hypothetical protein